MSLTTFSSFYFGHTITSLNNKIDFDEGGGELTATLNVGSYSLTDFLVEVKRALDAAGAFTYTVAVNRTTRIVTISAGSSFTLRIATGTHSGSSTYTLLGYTGGNVTGTSHASTNPTGSKYEPQFILQDHISSDDWQQAADSTVNKTASGKVEVVKFGDESFVQMNIKFATNIAQANTLLIKNNAQGKLDLETFMQYLVTKAEVEYMPDLATPATFQTLLLESAPEYTSGTGYKLKELYDRGLPGYFETGILKLRVII